MENREQLEKCIVFLNRIGIKTAFRVLGPGNILPGLSVENGCIIIDMEALKYPGDILHEAGHIAVVPSVDRQTLNAAAIEKRKDREAEEMMAIAWSYAACVYLDLDPGFVFHDGGYKGGGSHLAGIFKDKHYIGLPMLQWIGLATDEKSAAALQTPAYPHMTKWLRD